MADMHELVYDAADEQGTERLGAASRRAAGGNRCRSAGHAGAGKTRLVQAIAAACGVERADVVSPTFVLCATYCGNRTIHHLDAYRLRDEDEFREFGADELFASDALTIIEWADKVAGCLPEERLEIDIDVTGPNARLFTLRASGERMQAALEQISKQFTGWGRGRRIGGDCISAVPANR